MSILLVGVGDMPKTVVKKDGRKEAFIKEKIVVSALKTGAPPEVARGIADNIEQHPREELKTSWIRRRVLNELKLHNPDLPKRWINYDVGVKRLYKYKH
jgi:transcriptional regulator NrdR family protein